MSSVRISTNLKPIFFKITIKGKAPISEGIPKQNKAAKKRNVRQMKGKGVAYSVPPIQIKPRLYLSLLDVGVSVGPYTHRLTTRF